MDSTTARNFRVIPYIYSPLSTVAGMMLLRDRVGFQNLGHLKHLKHLKRLKHTCGIYDNECSVNRLRVCFVYRETMCTNVVCRGNL